MSSLKKIFAPLSTLFTSASSFKKHYLSGSARINSWKKSIPDYCTVYITILAMSFLRKFFVTSGMVSTLLKYISLYVLIKIFPSNDSLFKFVNLLYVSNGTTISFSLAINVKSNHTINTSVNLNTLQLLLILVELGMTLASPIRLRSEGRTIYPSNFSILESTYCKSILCVSGLPSNKRHVCNIISEFVKKIPSTTLMNSSKESSPS
jgi:hypothetical protein